MEVPTSPSQLGKFIISAPENRRSFLQSAGPTKSTLIGVVLVPPMMFYGVGLPFEL